MHQNAKKLRLSRKVKFKMIDVIAMILGAVIGFIFLEIDMSTEEVDWLNLALILLPSGLVLALGKGIEFRPVSVLYSILLVAIGVMSAVVDEPSTTTAMIMLLISYFLFFNLRQSVFFAFILGNCLPGLCLFITSTVSIINGLPWQGNRVPIHITIIGLLGVYLLNESHIKKRWIYLLLAIILVNVFITRSRTALLACCIAIGLQYIIDMRGRLTLKKLVIGSFSVFLVMGILYVNQDQIAELLFSKWGASTASIGLTSGRPLMWLDVLSDIRFSGYGKDYPMIRYAVQNIHNGYIQAYVSYGVVVGILYLLWKIFYTVKLVSLNKQKQVSIMLITFVPLLFLNIFESIFLFDPSYPYMGFLDAILMGRAFKIIADVKKREIGSSNIDS